MAVKFSGFASAGALSGSDIWVGLQGGVNVKGTWSQVLTYINPNAQLASTSQVTGLASALAALVPLAGGTMTGPLILSADPLVALGAATKQYVDAQVSSFSAGLFFHASCVAASTANLTATYNNGSSGVGATLTNSGTQVAFSLDGSAGVLNARYLIKDQTTTFQNGIYTLTTVGSGSVNWILTRATDFDQASASEVASGAVTSITAGTTNINTSWVETGVGPFTIGTTPIIFSIFNQIVAGTGLAFSGNTLNITLVPPANGGTGVNNGVNTLTFAGNLNFANAFSTVGNFPVIFNFTGSTNLIFPTSGTVATVGGGPTSAASISGVQEQSYTYSADTGTANTYVATLSPAVTSYVAANQISLLVTNENTGPSTLNANAVGATNITLDTGETLSGGEILPNMIAKFENNGITWQLMNPAIVRSYGENLIIGGDFSTNPFQRGVQFNNIGGTITLNIADRFQAYISSSVGATFDYNRDTQFPSVPLAGSYVTGSLLMSVTSPVTSVAANDFYTYRYPMEGYDFIRIAQRNFTLSFYAQGNAGTYSVGLRNAAASRSYVTTYTLGATNTWQKIVLNIPASPAGAIIGFNYTNGVGLEILFSQAAGSNFQTSVLNSWQISNAFAAATQQNALAVIGNIFEIAKVKVEPGMIATPWQPENVDTVLKKCQRYCYMTFPQGSTFGAGSFDGQQVLTLGNAVTNGSGFASIHYPTMRSAPSIRIFSPNSGALGKVYNNNTMADVAVSIGNIGDANATLFNNSGATIGDGSVLSWQFIAESEL